jgi:hypothetical protein
MNTVKITSVGVEFPTNTTTVTLDLIKTTGKIDRVLETLSITIEGIYQIMTSELYDKVMAELVAEGFDVTTTATAE